MTGLSLVLTRIYRVKFTFIKLLNANSPNKNLFQVQDGALNPDFELASAGVKRSWQQRCRVSTDLSRLSCLVKIRALRFIFYFLFKMQAMSGGYMRTDRNFRHKTYENF